MTRAVSAIAEKDLGAAVIAGGHPSPVFQPVAPDLNMIAMFCTYVCRIEQVLRETYRVENRWKRGLDHCGTKGVSWVVLCA